MPTPSPNETPHRSGELHVFDTRLLERIERRSKWAGLAVLIGAVIVLVSFASSITKLRALREATSQAKQKLDETSGELAAKQQALAASKKQLEQLDSQLKFRQTVYAQLLANNQIPAAALSTAAENAIQGNPNLVQQIPPTVSIQISRQDQRSKAQEIKSKLEALKYQVLPEIDFVGKRAPKESQIRYFFKSDASPELSHIQGVLQEIGVSATPQFIGLRYAPPTLRPRVFEVWLGLEYTPPPARE
jgi:hypothetical protein